MKQNINEIKRMQELAGLKEASYLDRLEKRAGAKPSEDDEEIEALSSVFHFMSDEVQEAGRELEKELKRAGVKLATNAYLINAIKYLVMAAKHSK